MNMLFTKLFSKDKIIPIVIGLSLVACFNFLNLTSNKAIRDVIHFFENIFYDFYVEKLHKPLDSHSAIAIIDIDDRSIKEKGRWPWPRNLLADLVEKLQEKKPSVLALDLTFPEASKNVAEDVLKEFSKIEKDEKVIKNFQSVEQLFDYDSQFAKALGKGESVLGFVFTDRGKNSGVLPRPFMALTPDDLHKVDIPDKQTFLANIDELQEAAKFGGFINATPDPDGVLRYSPILYRRGADVFASLGLEAASQYLLVSNKKLLTEKYGDSFQLEGVQLDQLIIPTDPEGRILIPFRGPAYTFKYISVADVLDGKVSQEALEGKLLFLGFSAEALGDEYPTSIAPIFPGVEIHATIASGILDNYLPYKPFWIKGATSFFILTIGTFLALAFPFLGTVANAILITIFAILLFLSKYAFWNHYTIVLPILVPIALLLLLYLFNTAWAYFLTSKRGKELKTMFGQYIPPEYLDEMIKKGGQVSLEGESKELTVLFSDIRSFTSLSEKMSATELKNFLNQFLSPITEVIFKNRGTIDKYVGDMVMAFWGAPMDNPRHAYLAVKAGLEMQAKLKELNREFMKEKKLEVKIGVGINTDLMNVGDMGSVYRRAYTVIGDAVNLGSRLEGQSKYYHVGIIVGEKTWLQTNKDFIYRKLDKIKVKGKDKAVEIYQPICLMNEATAEQQQEMELHHRGLEAYFTQNWETAATLFNQLKSSYSSNKELYEVYLSRIENLKTTPFQSDWDGAYVSYEK